MEEYDAEQDQRIIDLARSEPERALELAKDLAVRFPATGRSWAKLSYAYAMAKKPADSLSAMKRAVEIDPGEPAYQFAISRNYMEAGDFRDAIETLSRCIELSDELQNDYYVEASFLYRAHCHHRLGFMADAEKDLERVTDDARLWMGGLISKADILQACRRRECD